MLGNQVGLRINNLLLLDLVILMGSSVAAAQPPALELQEGDHICYIGNTLADRMQHDGWLETLIQSRFPNHDLVFRNLGFPGDEIDNRPRSANFGSPDDWLTRTEADVVFAFFGYSESFAGEGGSDSFRSKLSSFVDHTRAQHYNGRSAPRLVLFSPIAHEDLQSPHLPDGSENNIRLAMYTKVSAEVATEKGVPFVDLYSPTRELYASSKAHLTINGIHLTPEGNRLVAQTIDRALFGRPRQTQPAQLAKLRGAVVDKNFHWFSLYRTVDGYNVYGGRSSLAWHGQSNADVMQREMEVFDVMTQNRDRRVWAVARGGDTTVDDSQAPPLVEVKTNKPGPLEGGRYPFLGGEAAIDKMTIGSGLQVNLFASEEQFPDLVNPVQMSVDADGRLWVATWPTYPHWNPKQQLQDKIVILPDEDGDGQADRLIVFADGLNSVTGFEFWGGGVLVAAAPEILFLKDTDGDDRADVKIRMLQGVSSADTHHTANSLVIAPDGGLYYSRGVFHVTNMETPTKTFRSTTSGVYRFDPRTFEVDFHFPIGPNPHGHVIDQWGYQFASDGTSGTGSYISIGKGIGAPKQWYEKRVRPVPATGILSSSHFPEANDGNFLICNAIGFLGVLQHRVEYNGADIRATEIEPILYSADPNFRPTDLEVGGDGALYVSDWCNPLIGHMQHNIRDPNRDHLHGRVYRVTAQGRPLLRPAKMKGKPIEEVLPNFYAAENGTRYRARLELSGRDTQDVIAAVSSWTDGIEPETPADEQALLESLWVLEEHRVPHEPLLQKVLRSKEPRVRAAAIRTLGHWGPRIKEWEPLLLSAASDPEPLVRAEAAKAATSFEGLAAAEVIFQVAVQPTDVQLDFVLDYARGKIDVDRVVQDALQSGAKLSVAAQTYVLQSASVDDLLKMERSEAVFTAILARSNVPASPLREALAGLAEIRQTGQLGLLLKLIEEQDARDGDGSLSSLGALLAEQPQSKLVSIRDRLIELSQSAKSSTTRRAAFAAWISADGAADDALLVASKSKTQLRELLDAVALVPEEQVRARIFPQVRRLMFELPENLARERGNPARRRGGSSLGQPGIRVEYFDPSGADVAAETLARMKPKAGVVIPDIRLHTLHDVAIGTLKSIPGQHVEKFNDLAQLIKAGRHRTSTISAIREIPPQYWVKKEVPALVDNLVAYLSEIPARYRTSKSATDAMELARQLATKLPATQSKAIGDRLANLDVHVIAIGTVPHRMIYDKQRIAVKAGKPVEFRFSNTDNMPHNLTIVQPGGMEEVGLLAEATARDADAMARQYIPRSDKILLKSRLLQPGESQALSFEAPNQPGVYPYVCTYPGHWRRMHGALYVVKDIEAFQANREAYLASHALPIRDELLKLIGTGREWQVGDLLESAQHLHGRSFEVGQNAFKVSSCSACHRLGSKDGQQIGPDLTKLDATKRNTMHILRSLINPSETIEEEFQSHVFELDSGKTVTGMILEETPDSVKIIENPLAKTEPLVIPTKSIDFRRKSPKSMMPEGLASRLTREEILDLIAYVFSAGKKDHEVFTTHHDH